MAVTVKEYVALVKDGLAKKDAAAVAAAGKAACDDPAVDEDSLAWIAGAIYESDMREAFGAVAGFTLRFPNSLHIIGAYWAGLLERMKEFDAASDEARNFLCRVRKSEHWGKLAGHERLRTGVTGAVCILPAAYRHVGALSHCTRILHYGTRLGMGDESRAVFVNELFAVNRALRDPRAAEIDARWEGFFGRCKPLPPDLFEQCQKSCPLLARRLDLIEGNIRFVPDYNAGIEEFMQHVMQTKDGAFVLA